MNGGDTTDYQMETLLMDDFDQGLTDIASALRRKDPCVMNAGTAAFVLRARDRLSTLRAQVAAMQNKLIECATVYNGERERLREQLSRLDRKAQHGCYGFRCAECDGSD